MTSKQPRQPLPPTKEDRLAKALRDNLARRKALVRARKAQGGGTDAPSDDDAIDPANPRSDDEPL
ncbi:hypothetical protein [Hyphomicrobium sp.]|uniref:hypothetical protein n=1 Tax=Hyphomicrobium sp. TaxID=82 RepID=UPI003F72DBBD